MGGKECEHAIFLFQVQMLDYSGQSGQWPDGRKGPQGLQGDLSRQVGEVWGNSFSQSEGLKSGERACPQHSVWLSLEEPRDPTYESN